MKVSHGGYVCMLMAQTLDHRQGETDPFTANVFLSSLVLYWYAARRKKDYYIERHTDFLNLLRLVLESYPYKIPGQTHRLLVCDRTNGHQSTNNSTNPVRLRTAL